MITQRNISKTLGGVEDILFGFGNVIQTRGSADHTITKIDKIHIVDDLVDLKVLDSDIYRTCFVLGQTDLGVGFSNQYFWLADKGTLSYDGLLVVQKTGDSVGAWIADNLNLVAGTVEAQGKGPHSFGGVVDGKTQLKILGTFTGDGSGTTTDGLSLVGNIIGAAGDTTRLAAMFIDKAITTQTATETIDLVTEVFINEPNITDNLTGDITTAVSVYIAGAPTEGLSNYALFVDSGATRLDGTLSVLGAIATFSRVDTTPDGTADTDRDDIVVGSENTANTGLTLFSSSQSGIAFADSGDPLAGLFGFKHTTNTFEWDIAEVTQLLLSTDLLTMKGRFTIDQDNNDFALDIDSESTSLPVMRINNAQIIDSDIISIANADALTSGSMITLHSNSSSATGRNLFEITNQNTSAVNAVLAALQQSANGSFIDFSGLTGADVNSAVSTLNTSGATTDHIQISLNGTKAWIAISTVDPT